MKSVSLILLAAGGSTRMGAAKQLLDFGGKPLVRHTVEAALHSTCQTVIVVLGREAEAVRKALADLPLQFVENPDWSAGIGSSIRAGLSAVTPETSGVIISLADQPMVSSDILNHIITLQEETSKPIVAAQYAGTVGVPAYFSRALFPALQALPPDQGCKKIILTHRDEVLLFDCPEAESDIDTPHDYERLRPN